MLIKFIGFICLFSCLLNASENGVLTVGTNAEFPPFTYIENETIVGFDIDIAKEVAKRLNKNIQFKDVPFDALIPELMLGRIDFVAAGLSYTEERAKRVSFTKNYLSEDPFVLFTKSNNCLKLDDLSGKTIVVIEGFTADTLMSTYENIHLIRLPTQADGFMAIKCGRADGFVTAKSTVDAFFIIQDPNLFHVTPFEGSGETCALVLSKNNKVLLNDIQLVLDEMENDGTLYQLKSKWKLAQ